MSLLGSRVLRTEDPKFLTGASTYVDDLREPLLDGALHVTFVRSAMAHALVTVDVTEATTAPGVVAIFSHADLVAAGVQPLPPGVGVCNPAMTRPLLSNGTVRFVGDVVAAVVSEGRGQGVDAAELVVVDYDPLPPVIGPEAGVADGARLVHEAAGTNITWEIPTPTGNEPFDGCEVVISERFVNQRLAGCPLEPRGAAAAVGSDGRLHLWISAQNAHGVKDEVVAALGLDPQQVRVVAPDVGGGFGPKIGAGPEELLVSWITRQLGRPTKWIESRIENMTCMPHGRAQVQDVTLGGRRDGTIEAYRIDVLQDIGAYPMIGAFLPFFTRMMASGTYAIPNVEAGFRSVVTNTTPIAAYRGAGRPEATAAVERMVDIFAAEIGVDPVDVRRRNLIPPDAFPFTTPTGTTYDTGNYVEALDRALAAAGYEELRQEQARRRASADGLLLGIGVSTYVEITAGPQAGGEYGAVEVQPDGTVVVRTGTSPHGQGHATSWAMIASDRLGIPMERIHVIHGDTDEVPSGVGTFGSRSLQLGGAAVHQAAEAVVALARERAAEQLEASLDDIVFDLTAGTFHVAGSPSIAKTWTDVAAAGDLAASTDFNATTPTFPFGAHVAVVEVDAETGRVQLARMITCDDSGRIVNPMIVEGQRHGGIAQGAAQALLEEMVYDDDGNPLTANFADYAVISACELPSFELVTLETPTPANPLGAKGIGESGTIGSTPAIHNAVVDAVAHLGVRHIDLPLTPARVWAAIESAKEAQP